MCHRLVSRSGPPGSTRGSWIGVRGLAVLLTGVSFLSVGCFGRFALVRKVYGFNQRVDPDKWIQWGAFVVMNFIPVYGAAAFIDAVFANSVEFWTGENPIVADSVQSTTGPNGEVATLHVMPGGVADFSLVDAEGGLHELRLKREPAAVAVYAPDGELLGRVVRRDGQLVRLDP